MKRFVTYLYSEMGEGMQKNVGFVRVNVLPARIHMHLHVQSNAHKDICGKVYAFTYKEEVGSEEISDIALKNGRCDLHLDFERKARGWIGVGVYLTDGTRFIGCWDDVYSNAVAAYEVVREEAEVPSEKNVVLPEMNAEELCVQTMSSEDTCSYEKIDLSEIRNLPSPNWHFATNSFLLHGFWNYGYLVLKKNMEAHKEILSLGVPGVFEKPEAVMALFFGFEDFEAFEENSEVLEKKNQDPKVGSFGCWFVKLKNEFRRD